MVAIKWEVYKLFFLEMKMANVNGKKFHTKKLHGIYNYL